MVHHDIYPSDPQITLPSTMSPLKKMVQPPPRYPIVILRLPQVDQELDDWTPVVSSVPPGPRIRVVTTATKMAWYPPMAAGSSESEGVSGLDILGLMGGAIACLEVL